jgi:hypothetical protein
VQAYVYNTGFSVQIHVLGDLHTNSTKMDAQAAKAAIVQKEALDVFIVKATAASWPFFILATVVFCMRTVSRIKFTEAKLGIEDIIITLSYVSLSNQLESLFRTETVYSFVMSSEWSPSSWL